jgi:MFS family permease
MARKTGVRTILYLYLAVFLTRIGFGSVTIIFPIYLHAASFQVGLILALYPIAEATSAMPVGRLADRFSRKKLHVFGMFFITILTAAIGFTTDLYKVSIIHGLMGFSAATAAVTSLTILGDATKQTNRGKGMGGFDLANLAGYGVGFGVGSVLVNLSYFQGHLNYAFWFTASIFLVTGVIAMRFLQEPVKVEEFVKRSEGRERKIGGRIRPIMPVWIAQTVILGMYFLLPKTFKDASYVPTSQALIFLGVLGGLFVLGTLIFGHISDKLGRTKIMILGAFGELGFLAVFGWSWPNFLYYQYLLAPLFFLASAIAPTILAYVSDISGKAKRGSANALYSMVLSLGLAIGNIVGGFVGEYGIRWIFLAGAGILFPCVLASSTMLRSRRK